MTQADPAPQPRMSWWLRILVALLIGLLVAAAAAAIILWFLWSRVPADQLAPIQPGAIEIAPALDGTLTFQDFEAAIDSAAGAVTIARASDGAVIWRNDPGTAFVGAGLGQVAFEERSGHVWVQVVRDQVLSQQTLTGASTDQQLRLTGTLVGADAAPYTVTVTPIGAGAIQLRLEIGTTADGEPVSSTLLASGRSSERVHGLGAQFRPFDLNGTVTPILSREQGVGRGEQPISFLADLAQWAAGDLTTTYAALPSYITGDNQAVTLADDERAGAFAVADFTNPDQARLESWSRVVTAVVSLGDSPADAIARRGATLSRPDLADWVQQGAVLGLTGGTAKVERVVAEMAADGAAISAVWLQDWTGQRDAATGSDSWWTWQLDRQRYPRWEELLAGLDEQGIRLLTYLNPWLVDAQEKGEPDIRNLYREALEADFLVLTQDGQPYLVDHDGFSAGLVDFTNPAAQEWFAGVIAEEVLGVGAVGFMADLGERLPIDAVLFEGTTATLHNRYPQLWAETVRLGCDQAGVPDCLAFMRSSHLGSPTLVPMMWAGEQLVTFAPEDGLASAILGMHAGGVSGSPLWHSDIGGTTSVDARVRDYARTDELNQRWAEMEAFGVMMRTTEGTRPEQDWQVHSTPEARAAFARSTRLFAALAEYREAVVAEAVLTGVPARRHTWLVFPDSAAAAADLQFFLGEHLLVAPVTAAGAIAVEVHFPPGDWVHALTGVTYRGDRITEVSAPLGTPAVFVLAGDPVGEEIVTALQGVL